MLYMQPKCDYYTTETKRGTDDSLVHNIRYDFNNKWELSLSLGPHSYSRKVPGTNLYEQVEAAVFYKDNMIYFTKTSDSVIPYLPVNFIQWICEILAEANLQLYPEVIEEIDLLLEKYRAGNHHDEGRKSCKE